MSNTEECSWMAAMRCPFCKEEVVSTYIPAELPEGVHEEDCSHEVSECRHVAGWGVWGYEEFTVATRWEDQVNLIAKAFVRKGLMEEVEDDIADVLDAEYSYKLLQVMRRAVPGVDVAYETMSISNGDGLRGDGCAVYMFLFMQKKKRKPAKSAPRRAKSA